MPSLPSTPGSPTAPVSPIPGAPSLPFNVMLSTLMSLVRATVTVLPSLVTAMFSPSPLNVAVPLGLTLLLATPPESVTMFQPALATVLTSFNWLTLTASVSAVPAAKLVILSPPMLMPLPLMVGPLVMETLFKPVKSDANLTVNVSVPLPSIPMLPSVKVPVLPPTMFSVSPNLRATSAPVSPAKVNGLFANVVTLLST